MEKIKIIGLLFGHIYIMKNNEEKWNYCNAIEFVRERFVGDGVTKGMSGAGGCDISLLGRERPIAITSGYCMSEVLPSGDPIVRRFEPRLTAIFIEYLGEIGLARF